MNKKLKLTEMLLSITLNLIVVSPNIIEIQDEQCSNLSNKKPLN